jgi:class 3 adenylate cyclase
MTAETRYAKARDGTYVAYQVSGEGPLEIVLLRGWNTNVEHEWDEPTIARMIRRLSAVGRLVRLDRRGMGMSDRIDRLAVPTLEDRVDDITAVLDAIGSRRAVLVGLADGGQLCAAYAAIRPDRTLGLVTYGALARGAWASDYPWAPTPEAYERWTAAIRAGWATPEFAARGIAGGAPSRADDAGLIRWLEEDMRLVATADEAVALATIDRDTDIRPILASIQAPTLVLARAPGVDAGKDLAARIPGARFEELPGSDPMAISGDLDAVLRAISAFVEGLVARKVEPDLDRVLVTVLFADVVDSTGRAVELGDRRWAGALSELRAPLRELVARYRGREVDTAGDGYFAAFDGPGRAIRCALGFADAGRRLGLPLRLGLHTGECEAVGDELRGLAVHIGARICSLAGPSEVLVSGTVRDLVAGSGIEFADRGLKTLKGVPGAWPVHAVVADGGSVGSAGSVRAGPSA